MPGVNIVNNLPSFVTREQHSDLTSSTPASFAELPAVLYHKEEGASISLDPPVEGFSEIDCSNGTMYFLSSVLVFASASGKCLEITYPTISLHAISRADLGPSLYCQLDELLNAEEEPTQDEENDTELRELRINPQSADTLEAMFEALSQCAALHPDEDGGEEEEDFDDAFLDAGVLEDGGLDQGELSEAGRATLARLETLISDPHGHLASELGEGEAFEDADSADDHTPGQPNGVDH